MKIQPVQIDNSKLDYAVNMNQTYNHFMASPELSEKAEKNAFEAECPPVSFYAQRTKDMETRRIEFKGLYMEFQPSATGLPTFRDSDIITYCVCWINNEARRGHEESISPLLRFKINDYLAFAKQGGRGGNQINLMIESLKRLAGSRIVTNTRPFYMEDEGELTTFSYLTSYELQKGLNGEITDVVVELPPRFFELAKLFNKIPLLHTGYFELPPFQRSLFNAVAMYCDGVRNKEVPCICTMDTLYKRMGSTYRFRDFREYMESAKGHLLHYVIDIDDKDNVLCTFLNFDQENYNLGYAKTI